jgi:hypothetical protein
MMPSRRILLRCTGVATLLTVAALLVIFRGRAHDSAAVASVGSGPPHCAAMWASGFELEGLVGERESQAYFDMSPVSGAPDQVSGIVIFPEERTHTPLADTPIGLAGPLDGDSCAVQLTASERDTDDSVWSLRIASPGEVTGTRRLRDGQTEAIAFRIVPNTPCEDQGEWRAFSSPDWPIAFDYPAGWVITHDHDDIALECPSVAQLARGGSWLSFEQGHFAPRDARSAGDDGSFTEPFWFSRLADDDWRVNDQACGLPSLSADRSACRPARRSERNGMTVLQAAAGEHRLYRPGVGYLGQGVGITRYLFVAGDRWVSLDMAGTNSHDDDIGSEGGPVLLDGDGVGDRVVRTVRRR